MHRPERTKWKLVIDRLRPPADLGRRGPLMMPAPRAGVHSDALRGRGCASGGAEETRTPDFLLAKEALYQLSYGPVSGCAANGAAAPSIASVSERSSGADTAPRGEAALSVAPGCSSPRASGRFWTRTRDLCLIRAVL
jgi:hypothetical protein